MKTMKNEKIIKNKRGLLKNLPADAFQRRKILLNIANYVLKNIQPEKLLRGSLSKRNFKKFRRILLIGIGKAAKGMVKGIVCELPKTPWKILLADSGHPLPTQKGIQNTKKIIEACRNLTKNDLAIVCLSGGGSSMFTLPIAGITLQDKIKLTNALLKSGATIQEINVVRKHISAVKGGQLASLLFPATVWGFVISDVPGNDLSTIASGPLSPDNSTPAQALAILKKYRIKIQKHILPHVKSRKFDSRVFKNIHIKIIGDHTTSLTLSLKKAKQTGFKTHSLGSHITGEARSAAKKLLKGIRDQPPALRRPGGGSGINIYIGSGETTVTCKGKGFGGRNQEFALAALPFLKKNQTLLALATDGVDGMCPEKIAGVIADHTLLAAAKKNGLHSSDFLNRNDSYSFFKKTGGLIKTGPTGTNLGDLIMIATS